MPPRKRLARLLSDEVSADLEAVLSSTEHTPMQDNHKAGEVRCFAACKSLHVIADTRDQKIQSPSKAMSRAKEAATDAARQAVFQTNELVENILVHLPAKTIFGVQRVCKSFRNATTGSVAIQEKLFLRPRPKALTKVMVWGVQHTASALNPLFTPGDRPYDRAVGVKRLKDLQLVNDKYGVTVKREQRMRMESSFLDTYLLDVPFRKLRLSSLRLWVGRGGPAIIVNNVDIGTGKTMSIREMVEMVLNQEQNLGLAFDVDKWRKDSGKYFPPPHDPRQKPFAASYFDEDDSDSYNLKYIRKNPVPRLSLDEIVPHLNQARVSGTMAQWRCDAHEKPRRVIEKLQAAAGFRSRTVYVKFCERPTFLLHDVVIPSPEDWAEIEARSG